jgi:hypothetical protein
MVVVVGGGGGGGVSGGKGKQNKDKGTANAAADDAGTINVVAQGTQLSCS